ncbi:V-set domain-containing T-cell activation inhibitor 1 isoform X1 [Arapaima gigas]
MFPTGKPGTSVESGNQFPVGNLGDDILLDCSFDPTPANGKKAADASVTWTKDGLTGVVYRYENHAPQLQDQNMFFRDMAQVFPDAIAKGNASLLLHSVVMEDAGTYLCSVVAPSSQGTVSIQLRVAAFSAPSFSKVNGTLTAVAPRWFPKPIVTWSTRDGSILKAQTSLSSNSTGVFRVRSTLTDPAQLNVTCTIHNSLVKAISQATVTDTGILSKTFYIISASPSSELPSRGLMMLPLLGRLLC